MIKRIIVGLIETNCYIYYNESGNCVIIDPGWNEHKIMAKVLKLKLNPSGIILTHGHFDHTGALGRLRTLFKKRGMDVPIAIHEKDKQYLGESSIKLNQNFFSQFGIHSEHVHNLSALPQADLFLKEGDDAFDLGLKVLETPGHTPGSICLYCEKDSLLFSGDTIFNGGIGRTDFPGSSEEAIISNIKAKILVLPPDTYICPGHGPETQLDWEKENNPFIV